MKTLTFVVALSLIVLAHEAPVFGLDTPSPTQADFTPTPDTIQAPASATGRMPEPLVDLPLLPKPQPLNITPYKSLFTDTPLQRANLNWNPEVLNTKLPTVYTPLPVDNSAVDQANRQLNEVIQGYNKAAARQSNQRTRNHQR